MHKKSLVPGVVRVHQQRDVPAQGLLGSTVLAERGPGVGVVPGAQCKNGSHVGRGNFMEKRGVLQVRQGLSGLTSSERSFCRGCEGPLAEGGSAAGVLLCHMCMTMYAMLPSVPHVLTSEYI